MNSNYNNNYENNYSNNYNNSYKKYYHKNFKRGYNHKEWIYFLNKIIDFLLMFGSIINLIVFAVCGLKIAGLTSFICFSVIGIAKTIVKIIKQINNVYSIWNN